MSLTWNTHKLRRAQAKHAESNQIKNPNQYMVSEYINCSYINYFIKNFKEPSSSSDYSSRNQTFAPKLQSLWKKTSVPKLNSTNPQPPHHEELRLAQCSRFQRNPLPPYHEELRLPPVVTDFTIQLAPNWNAHLLGFPTHTTQVQNLGWGGESAWEDLHRRRREDLGKRWRAGIWGEEAKNAREGEVYCVFCD